LLTAEDTELDETRAVPQQEILKTQTAVDISELFNDALSSC